MKECKQAFSKIIQWIYPKKCIICRKILTLPHQEYLCDQCETDMLKEHICPRCGKPYYIGEGETCLYCEKTTLPYTRLIGLFPYREKYKESVLRWKYHGIRKYAKGFSYLFVHELEILDTLEIDALIPVPISPDRLMKRGFNQAFDLAQNISLMKQIPLYDILKREVSTVPQSQCTREQRKQNIRGTIKMQKISTLAHINNIAIVDDIYTTGSTVEECIRTLSKEKEFSSIYVLVVCLGI